MSSTPHSVLPQSAGTTGTPSADANLIALASTILLSWKQRPQLTLQWFGIADLEALIRAFELSHERNQVLRINRRAASQRLKDLNQEIDQSTEYVKAYISEQFTEEEALSYYPAFGLEKTSRTNKLPLPHDKRLQAILQMSNSLKEYRLYDKPYGCIYWENMYQRFEDAKNCNANKVLNTKAEQKNTMRRLFNSLILLIKANYPLTWRDELRKWGFVKEKY